MENGELKTGILISDNHVNSVNYYDKNKEIRLDRKNSLLSKNKFIKNIFNSLNNEPDHILPKNTKFYKRFGNRALYVLEWDPSIRTIYFNKDMSSEYYELVSTGKDQYLENASIDQNKFTLSFPYIVWVFVVDLKSFSIIRNDFFFKLTPLESLYDYLIFPPLTNILPSNDFKSIDTTCFGSSDAPPSDNIQELVENRMSLFFKNSFNADYDLIYTKYRDYKESTFSNIFVWEYKTKNDPYFIFDDKWVYTKLNLKGIIESNFRDFHDSEMYIDLFELAKRNVKMTYKNKPIIYSNDSQLERFISPNCVISVGDDIKINDRLCYVESFGVGYNREEDEYIDVVSVEYEDTGETEEFILDEEKRNEIEKYFERNSRTTKLDSLELDSGDIIKPGDFVLNRNNPMGEFLKVLDITKSNDGIIEINTSNNVKFIPNSRIIKFSYKNVCNLLGGKLRKGTLLSSSDIRNSPRFDENLPEVYYQRSISFNGFKNVGDKIAIKFDEYEYVTNFNNLKVCNFTKIDKPTFKHGLYTYLVLQNSSENKSYINVSENKNLVHIYSGNNIRPAEKFNSSLYHIFQDGKIQIPSIDGSCDIDFNIGDEVICSDWENVNEMMKIRKIISFDFYPSGSTNAVDFKIDENSDILEVRDLISSKLWDHVEINTIDEDSNERSFTYIQKYSSVYFSSSLIHSPTIRKVIRNYNDFNVGDKVKSKIPKIYGFPKKDVNKIIAFINDTGCEYPLALMSNTYTIRCNDLENYFEKINDDNVELAEVRNPNLNKQIGDMEILKDKYVDSFNVKLQTPRNKLILSSKGYGLRVSDCIKTPYGFLNPKFDSLRDSINETKYPNFMNWFKTKEED